MVELIVRLRKQLAEQVYDAGPDTIAWHLRHHHPQRIVAVSTISPPNDLRDHAATGELLRELTLNPHQALPRHRTTTRTSTPHMTQPDPTTVGPGRRPD